MPPKDTPKARPWVKILLVASLALNLLVLGVVAGALLSGPRDRDRNPLLRDLGFGPFVTALPKKDRAALTLDLRKKSGPFLANRRELRRSMDEILSALRAEPFDAESFAALIQRQRTWIQERQDLGAAALVARISQMSPTERAAYADALRERLRKGGPKPRKPKQD